MNSLKQTLADQRLTIGSWLQISHPLIPEILAPSGFDWLVVDMEHSDIELSNLVPMIVAIEANGMTPLVRVGENDPNLIKRVMDLGAHGVIVANVQTQKGARAAVDAVKYPPTGTRGVGLYRAQKFGFGFEAYKTWLSEESVVIAQIEHIDAVNNIDEILQVQGLDAFIIGPYDLSASLGKPGLFDEPDVQQALETVLAAAKRHHIPAGYHSVSLRPEDARKKINEGYTFLAFGVDFKFLGECAYNALRALKGGSP